MPTKKEPERCIKCNVELSWKELQSGAKCFICIRIENDKFGLVTDDTIQYDGRYD